MGEEKVFSEKIVTMTGYYNLRGTYKDLIGFLEDSLFYDTSAKDYDETNEQGNRGLTSIVEATRHRDDGLTFVLKFKCEFKGKDVKDKNIQSGTGKIMMNAYVKLKDDPDASKFAQFLKFISNKFVAHKDIEDLSEELGKEAAMIIARFKSNFKENP